MLSTDPTCRLAAHTALETQYLRNGAGRMGVVIANAPAHRGPVSIVQGHVPDFILHWIQAETEAWSEMHEELTKMASGQAKKKRRIERYNKLS